MAEIIVSIENTWSAESIINAIKMLKGVTSAKIKDAEDVGRVDYVEKKNYSERIKQMCRMKGSGITKEDIESDDRLSYLLNK